MLPAAHRPAVAERLKPHRKHRKRVASRALMSSGRSRPPAVQHHPDGAACRVQPESSSSPGLPIEMWCATGGIMATVWGDQGQRRKRGAQVRSLPRLHPNQVGAREDDSPEPVRLLLVVQRSGQHAVGRQCRPGLGKHRVKSEESGPHATPTPCQSGRRAERIRRVGDGPQPRVAQWQHVRPIRFHPQPPRPRPLFHVSFVPTTPPSRPRRRNWAERRGLTRWPSRRRRPERRRRVPSVPRRPSPRVRRPFVRSSPAACCCVLACPTAATTYRAATPTSSKLAVICSVTSNPGSLRGLMSPKPTVLNTVTVKYSASDRDSGSLKRSEALCSIRR